MGRENWKASKGGTALNGLPIQKQGQAHCSEVDRRVVLGLVGGVAWAEATQVLLLPSRAEALDTVTYTGAAGRETPVNCFVPKQKTKMGKVDLLGGNFNSDAPCTFGGFRVKLPYCFQCPSSFVPLSGFADGGPDPTGQLDARLQDPSTDALILVSSAEPPNAKDAAKLPWRGKSNLPMTGTPMEVLASLGPNLAQYLIDTSVEERDSGVYYNWELRNTTSKYNNHRLLTAFVRDGEMVLLACVASDKYWADLEPALRNVTKSFRVLP